MMEFTDFEGFETEIEVQFQNQGHVNIRIHSLTQMGPNKWDDAIFDLTPDQARTLAATLIDIADQIQCPVQLLPGGVAIFPTGQAYYSNRIPIVRQFRKVYKCDLDFTLTYLERRTY